MNAAQINHLSQAAIGAMIEVHSELGAGLLESAYEQCLCHELTLRGIVFQRQVSLPVQYKGILLDCSYKVDIVIKGILVLELKAVEKLEKIHEAQLLTYMRLGGWPVGLLVNFNVPVLKDGIRRRVLNFQD